MSVNLSSSSAKEKERMLSQLPAMQNRRSLKNGDARHSGTLFNTHSTDMWDDEKRPAVSLYLDELLIQKCQFRERFNASIFSLERLSPRVHATLTNPAWITHLLRNILSNYWCGMHLTCKNTSVKPDRRHWMIRSEKLCEGNHSNRSDAARSSSIDSGNSDCENCANQENWTQVVWNRQGGSWVGHFP